MWLLRGEKDRGDNEAECLGCCMQSQRSRVKKGECIEAAFASVLCSYYLECRCHSLTALAALMCYL